MKLSKFGIIVNKTTPVFTSIRDSNISRGVWENFGNSGGEVGGGGAKFWLPILENPSGRGGVIRQIPSVGVVWIFSGTTQLEEQRTGEPNDVFLQNMLKSLFRLFRVLFDLIIIIIIIITY